MPLNVLMQNAQSCWDALGTDATRRCPLVLCGAATEPLDSVPGVDWVGPRILSPQIPRLSREQQPRCPLAPRAALPVRPSTWPQVRLKERRRAFEELVSARSGVSLNQTHFRDCLMQFVARWICCPRIAVASRDVSLYWPGVPAARVALRGLLGGRRDQS